MSDTLVTFRVPSGAEFELRALEATPAGDGDVRVTVEADAETWGTIDAVELFNLGFAVRGPGTLSGRKPAQIELRPGAVLRERLAGLDEVAILSELARGGADDDIVMMNNWYATEVTEAVDLPPELADKGELREGFRTAHADGAPD